MIRKIIRNNRRYRSILTRNFSDITETNLVKKSDGILENHQIKHLEYLEQLPSDNNKSVLEPSNEDLSYIAPYLKPTFNFAAYINKSETLQELLKLGVNLYKIEKNVTAVPFVLGLKFENIREHIIFFKELGLDTEQIGATITKNPLILQEDLENLKIRINYLKYRKFTDEMILRVVSKNPNWLSHSTQEIDERLGFFQNQFLLTGDEVRLIAVKSPTLITIGVDKIKLNFFVLKEQMGFTQEELKQIILSKPTIFRRGQQRLVRTFDYLHNTMKIPQERILEAPDILTCRYARLKERHLFLVKLGKAQFDPKLPNYVALRTLVSGDDAYFSTEVAKSSVQTYNEFLKSL